MPSVEILADRVTFGGRQLTSGDVVGGRVKNLQPLVDIRAARWLDAGAGEEQGEAAPELDTRTWQWTVPEAEAAIPEIDDGATLRALHEAERRHPRYDGGRKGVLDQLEGRMGEVRGALEAALVDEETQTFGDG